MKGKILDFSIQENTGVISGEDGQRYKFSGASWKVKSNPRPGLSVDFDINDLGEAVEIYSDVSASASNSLVGDSGQPAQINEAILWFLCCLPIGFGRFGQTTKGWAWVLISFATGGIAAIPAWIDYWMCYSEQQDRKLSEWEFFPRK
jgi:hypothetical protein